MTYNKAFIEIRNYLSGRALGITRDKSLLHEVVKLLFCKISLNGHNNLILDSLENVSSIYRKEFSKIKKTLPDLFGKDEEILLDPNYIKYVHDILSKTDLYDNTEDPLSILYQTFLGNDQRGNEGQFFTPYEAVKFLVEAIAPGEKDKIIDPACGAGSFLSYSARYLKRQKIELKKIACLLHGIEKDKYLSDLAKSHISLNTFFKSNIVCGDSIENQNESSNSIKFLKEKSYDIVLANPPFGAKIIIGSENSLRNFKLAYKWSKKRNTDIYSRTDIIQKKPTPQVLFLELCVKLLRPGGRLGIVIPESLISSSNTSYVVQYLRQECNLRAIIGMPENLFKTSGKGGTHTKTCLIIASKKNKTNQKGQIFMAEAKWCGHDSRGNTIPNNDLPIILNNYLKSNSDSNLGYFINDEEIKNNILAPRYYNPEFRNQLEKLSETHDLIPLKDLIDNKIITISTGDEIGKLAYGTGDIPFVRTSDISNWEIKLDPKHGVSESIYNQFRRRQDVREGDILMVKDGTYLIGTCAYVSKYDTRILYQSHLYKIRVNSNDQISPYLLIAALSSEAAKKQIQSKRFTLDIIDSIGKRIEEIIIPIPKSIEKRRQIENMVKKSIDDRIESRELARKAKIEILE